ncbi:MAG: multiubiquitin domain-containing protein [Nitrospirales bacterium]|nr:multiubiquitin domain-containing protein [Nitrospirales bacterium]
MSEVDVPDEIEVVDLEEYACSGKPIPKRVKYYLIRVDNEKIRVQSPIRAEAILIAADLDPCEYRLEQRFKGGKTVALEPDQLIDLREPGIEHFVSIPTKDIFIIINGREKTVEKKKLSFAELIRLAFENPPTGENIYFTVTYWNGPKKKPEGSMVEGDIVKIKCGMVFNVTPTDKS